jgi:2-polyprenyl-6-methoxyphenol hydroxylase-like FAD-dependent oxidoreductase
MALSEAELGARLAQRHLLLKDLQLSKRGGSHVYRIKRTHAASYAGPHAALTGDAAHTINPVGGQGLNIAIQDSAKLAELLSPVLLDDRATEQAFTDALTEYEAIRRPINAATLELAHTLSQIAGPGEEPYKQAVEFYGNALDPTRMRQVAIQLGRPRELTCQLHGAAPWTPSAPACGATAMT